MSKHLYIHIDGSKCRNVDNMLVEFYDKLNISYPKFRSLDGLDDWLRDLSWIKDEYPEVKRIFAYGPGTDEMRRKDEKAGRVAYIGVPICFMIDNNTFTCDPISFKKYLQLKKENAR